jgi:endonuclease/exonuclease/phosphatase family metal-dependent hydrolase
VPKRLRVVHVTRSSFTVTARHTAAAHKFRLYASTNHHHLYVKHIKGAHRTKFAHRPMLTIRHLHYTTKPYWFRVEARNGSHRRFSADIGSVGLEPSIPTNLAVHTNLAGTYLTWNSGPATGFQITEATDPAMTQNVKTYTTENQDHQFSPPDLEMGTPYYFEIQALNALTTSRASSTVQAVNFTKQQPVRAMSYNLLAISADGRSEGGTHVAPWSQRRDAQVRLIKGVSPDVIAIQEGAWWVGPERGPRQVDDLVSHLGGGYSLATTEIPPSQPHYHRTGVYVVYNSANYATAATGGHWGIGDKRWAAYQILRNKNTGARFLFVAPHLIVIKHGGTDQKRAAETRSLVAQAESYNRAHGNLPIVYAGDFNSDPGKKHIRNAPSDYMLSQGYDDAYDVAQARSNPDFDSANGYNRVAPSHSLRIDYIFTQPGIPVKSWGMALNLSHHKFAGVIPSDHNPIYANLEIPYTPIPGGYY